jgi:hypothetical protein
MVRVVGVEEIKLGIVDLILPNPSFKLGSVSVKWQQSLVYHQITHLKYMTAQHYREYQTWQQSWLSYRRCFGPLGAGK